MPYRLADIIPIFKKKNVITADLDGALDAFSEIAAVTRIPVTGIINNTHLKEETTTDMVVKGQMLAEQLSAKTGIPVVYIGGREDILCNLPQDYQDLFFPIQTYINLKF